MVVQVPMGVGCIRGGGGGGGGGGGFVLSVRLPSENLTNFVIVSLKFGLGLRYFGRFWVLGSDHVSKLVID